MDDLEPGQPYLEHFPQGSSRMERIPLEDLPFTIGRNASAHFQIKSAQVSREHAALLRQGEEFRVRDLGSTNGTLLNGHKIQDSPIKDGDVLHIATTELVFRDGKAIAGANGATEVAQTQNLPAEANSPRTIIRRVRYLHELLTHRCIRVVFQPIVDFETREPIGFQALGRGNHQELSSAPTELFALATECRLADRLSQLFRMVALEEARQLPSDTRLFLHVHPTELDNGDLLETLRHAQLELPGENRLVVEIPEAWAPERAKLKSLHGQLQQWGIKLAYDDFRAGQARFHELIEAARPDYLKLDMALVRSIDVAAARRKLVQEIIQLSTNEDIAVVAKGIETDEQAKDFRELGCTLAQGYLFGRPLPASSLVCVAEV
jgi:EAL domain-containing protein (putative c-di-GMP-specific phosphodiesterase class I)